MREKVQNRALGHNTDTDALIFKGKTCIVLLWFAPVKLLPQTWEATRLF